MTNKEAAYILSDKCDDYTVEELRTAFDLAIKALEDRPQGEWVIDCPNCGAKMRGNDNG